MSFVMLADCTVLQVFNYDSQGSFGELALMYNTPRYCREGVRGSCSVDGRAFIVLYGYDNSERGEGKERERERGREGEREREGGRERERERERERGRERE